MRDEPLQETPLTRSVAEFCSRSEVAPKTRRFYSDSLGNIFLPWAEEEGLSEPSQLVPLVMERYATHLEERRKKGKVGGQLAVATRRAYLRAVRQYMGWLAKRRGVEGIDHKAVPMPRLRRQIRDVLTPAEMHEVEEAGRLERDKVILALICQTAAREGEVAAITVPDLILRDRRFHYVRLRGKTGDRMAPISPALYKRLIDYSTSASRPQRVGHVHLFMAHRQRNGGGYGPLTESGIYGIVKEAAERALPGRRVYPHLLRHSRITDMVAQGMNLVTISEIVGTSVQVLATHYVHQSDEQRHAAMMKVLEV